MGRGIKSEELGMKNLRHSMLGRTAVLMHALACGEYSRASRTTPSPASMRVVSCNVAGEGRAFAAPKRISLRPQAGLRPRRRG